MVRQLGTGDTISPQLWDALLERINAVQAASEFAGDEAAPIASASSDLRPRGAEFRNDSDLTVPAYAVLRVTGFSTADGHRALTVEQPDSTLARNYAVNGPVDVPAGQYGICYLGPLVEVLYDGGTPAAGEGFGPQSDEWALTNSAPAAFSVLGIIDAGQQIMACRFEPLSTVIGKLAGSLALGGSATVDIWAGAPGSEAAVSGLSIVAQDWVLTPEESPAPAGTNVVCQWINGAWYVTGAA